MVLQVLDSFTLTALRRTESLRWPLWVDLPKGSQASWMLRLFLQALRPVRDNREIPLSLLDLLLEAGIPEKPECLEMNSRRLLIRESPPLQAAALVSRWINNVCYFLSNFHHKRRGPKNYRCVLCGYQLEALLHQTTLDEVELGEHKNKSWTCTTGKENTILMVSEGWSKVRLDHTMCWEWREPHPALPQSPGILWKVFPAQQSLILCPGT